MVRNEAHELDCGKDATKPRDLTAENGGTKPHRGWLLLSDAYGIGCAKGRETLIHNSKFKIHNSKLSLIC